MALLEVITTAERGATVTEAADRAGLPLTSAHRLLAALVDSGLIVRDRLSNRYQPGSRLMHLAAQVNSGRRQDEELDRELEALRQRWQESVYAGALVDGQVACIRSLTNGGTTRATIAVPAGRLMPLHSSAAARAILSAWPEDDAMALLRKVERARFTEHTRTSLRDLRSELRASRARGFAACDQEIELGVLAVAVPVACQPGQVPVCLGAIGVRQRMQEVIDDGMIEALRRAAGRLAGHDPRVLTRDRGDG